MFSGLPQQRTFVSAVGTSVQCHNQPSPKQTIIPRRKAVRMADRIVKLATAIVALLFGATAVLAQERLTKADLTQVGGHPRRLRQPLLKSSLQAAGRCAANGPNAQ